MDEAPTVLLEISLEVDEEESIENKDIGQVSILNEHFENNLVKL